MKESHRMPATSNQPSPAVSNEITVNSIEEFNKAIESIGKYNLLYRGQGDRKFDVTSGIRRRMRSFSGEQPPTINSIIEYHKDLVRNARRWLSAGTPGAELDDFLVLCELQHFGAATFLIDFSTASQTALCFACLNEHADGKVFVIDSASSRIKSLPVLGNNFESLLSDTSDVIYRYLPNFSNTRITIQSSEFLFNRNGIFKAEDFEKVLVIPKTAKRQILRQLRLLHNVTEETLYPDFYGFANSNRHSAPFYYDDALDLLMQGRGLADKKAYKEAIVVLEQARKSKPNSHAVLCFLGYCYIHVNDSVKGKEILEKAVALSPECSSSQINLGVAYLGTGEGKKAVECFDAVLSANPDDAKALLGLGTHHKIAKNVTKAIEYFRKAVDLDPNDPVAVNRLAGALWMNKEFEESLSAYQKVLKLSPTDYTAAMTIGTVLASLKRPDEAVKVFNKAFSLDKTKILPLLEIGTLLLATGQFDAAKRNAAKLIKHFPGHNQAIHHLQLLRTARGYPGTPAKDKRKSLSQIKPPLRALYKAISLAGKYRLITHILFDRKNSSIHLHFYGDIFENKRTNVQVKHAKRKFPEGKDEDVIREIVPEYAPVSGLNVKSVTVRKESDDKPNGYPVRVIIRFGG